MIHVLEVAPMDQVFLKSYKHLKGQWIVQLRSIYNFAVIPLGIYYLFENL